MNPPFEIIYRIANDREEELQKVTRMSGDNERLRNAHPQRRKLQKRLANLIRTVAGS